jgi:uncharacterized metal-binding protein
MDGKIKQSVCIKFCVKLGKSATDTLEMLRKTFEKYSLSRTVFLEWNSRFKAGRVSVEDDESSGRQAPAERQKMLKISRTHTR